MLGATGVQFNRSRNGRDDGFYSSAKPSRYRSWRNEPPPGESAQPSPMSNLERFLESVTPSVPAQYLSKMTVRDLKTCDVEFQPFFVLGDLWTSFTEWSAYGAGVSLMLNGSDSVVQYYVPYLSGIQLYADQSMNTEKFRRLGEESYGDCFGDSSSDDSSDSDTGGTSDDSLRSDQFLSEQHMAFQEDFSSDEGESGNSRSFLLFEYFARDQPYTREPLVDKIFDLALHFPELKTLRSCDLLPSSWISVAWYPIYRIPTGPTLKDLDACFLTFHSLHTPITGNEAMHRPIVTYPSDSNGVSLISLPVFGLASYKYSVPLWTPNGGRQHQLADYLLQAADNWLNSLQVNHPDFSFFSRR